MEGGEQYDLHALVDGHDEWVYGLLGSLLLEKRKRLGPCSSKRETGLVKIEKHS